MVDNLKIIPIILCGGTGSRLWPLSRQSFPKQYLTVNQNNKDSFLQITLKRLVHINNLEKPIIICNDQHRFIAAEQLREIELEAKSIILEPTGKNTCPAITTAALKSLDNGVDHILLVLPSDHLIKDEKIFIEAIEKAKQYALADKLVTFGVVPNSPETGYGYIKSVKPFLAGQKDGIEIEKFVEKPDLTTAKRFIKDSSYNWNSGIYMFKASTVIREIEKFNPEILNSCKKSLQAKNIDLFFERLDKKSFKNCPNISFDDAIMEKTDLGVVIPLRAGWSDVGGWKAFWENYPKDTNGNFLLGDALEIDSKDNLIISNSRLTIGLGIENLIVIETNDAVLVTHKNKSEKVKDIVNVLSEKGRNEHKEHKKVYRPWGNYISIEDGSKWKVKKIEVKSGESLSLQMHYQRAEHWVVVTGTAKVEIGNKELILKENQSCFVPKETKHRLSNIGKDSLIIIEVQSGSYLNEDDIVRFEDKYGRSNL